MIPGLSLTFLLQDNTVVQSKKPIMLIRIKAALIITVGHLYVHANLTVSISQ